MVNFVGAGCGAEDLITVRGVRLLKEADVIIYTGSLVNEKLLQYSKKECKMYNSAYMNLNQVLDLIKKAEDAGLMTVRLHTGDPCLYGAIREQMDSLDGLGVKYEYCPGVSSFCGAAASLKAEYTLPGVSQTVIITRMQGKTDVPETERIRSLASHGATMVIFLSMGLIDSLAKELSEGGYGDDCPAAIVYKASWPDEKLFRCTVGELESVARENGIKKTALVVVGRFLGDDYSLSKLYDESFETEYRKAVNIQA